MKRKVMQRAWKVYRTLIGDRIAKLSMALRMAWKEVKEKEAKRMAKEKEKAEAVAFLQAHIGDYETILYFVKAMTHDGKITGGAVVGKRADMGDSNQKYDIYFGETHEDVAGFLARLESIASFELEFLTPEQEAERKAKNAASRRAVRYNAEQIHQNVYDNF